MLIELVNIGRDSELLYTQGGAPILKWPAAYDVGFGDNKKTQWIDCTLFGKKAEELASYLIKGKQIQISARDVRIETWQKNDGSGEGYKLCCTVDGVKFCRDGQGAQGVQGGNNQQQRPPQNPGQGGHGGQGYAQQGYQQQNQNYQQPVQQRQQPQQYSNQAPNRSDPAPACSFDDDIPF